MRAGTKCNLPAEGHQGIFGTRDAKLLISQVFCALALFFFCMTTYQSLDPVPKSLEREGKFYGRKPDEPVLLNTKERFCYSFVGLILHLV